MKKISFLIILSFLSAIALSFSLKSIGFSYNFEEKEPSNFEECVAQKNVVHFSPSVSCLDFVKKGCVVTGCSGQICAEEETATTCEFLPRYECYKDASCKIQPDGNCGWTMTEELKECLGKPL